MGVMPDHMDATLREIQTRLTKATPGPWTMAHQLLGSTIWGKRHEFAILKGNPKDIEFAFHAPTDLAYLLTRLEKAEATIQKYGHHLSWCAANRDYEVADCSCGFTTWQATRTQEGR